MSDELTLAQMLQNGGAAGKPGRPFWGQTQGWPYPGFPQKNSVMAEFLMRALTGAPMAIRSPQGAMRGNDFVTAHRLHQAARQREFTSMEQPDLGVTGGTIRVGGGYDTPSSWSAAGLAESPGMTRSAAPTPLELQTLRDQLRWQAASGDSAAGRLATQMERAAADELGAPLPTHRYPANTNHPFKVIPGGRD